ncbi:MAG TPA: glycoside hydrolase family 52 protein, partial [Treponemataceae bacterium]|nr:glycoside hydrolase family 52 protein [Treponemataceae bacterium]
MPVRIKDNDFYSLHGIWGADSCLALGRIGHGAGMVVGNVQPPQRALFVGYRSGSGRPVLLPFAPDVKVGLGADAFVADGPAGSAEAAANHESHLAYFGKDDIAREISMSGETWRAGCLSLTVTSFFGAVPDPEAANRAILRKGMRPAIYVRLTFDNTGCDAPMTGVFGMQGIRRPLSDSTGGALLGFAHPQDWGFAALAADDVEEAM